MEARNKKNELKSALLTTAIMSVLLLSLFFIGLRYMDPPLEYGVAVNFGNVEESSGPVNNTAIPPREQSSVPENPNPEPETSEAQNQSQPPSEEQIKADEPILSDEDSEIIQPTEEKPSAEEIEKQKQIEEEAKRKAAEEAARKKKQEEQKKNLDALFNGDSEEQSVSEGDQTKEAGLQGRETGDPAATDYYSLGGKDSDGNYRLSGRTVVKKPKYAANCEEGTIVVQIEVNQEGVVVKATPGVKGSTSQEPCLMNPAKKAAMETRFNPNPEAAEIQIGTIVYVFKNKVD
jgi:outer membrane biosynthesis protein TonB